MELPSPTSDWCPTLVKRAHWFQMANPSRGAKSQKAKRPTAKCQWQKAELTEKPNGMELQMELTELTSCKSHLQLHMQHDANGREYFIDQTWGQSRYSLITLPHSCYEHLQLERWKKSLVSLATAKISISSRILFTPTPKHSLVTGKKTWTLSQEKSSAITLFSY